MRGAAIVLIITAIAGLLVVLWSASAPAHDWYPSSCCGGHDCGPIPGTDLKMEATGWLVRQTGEVIPFTAAHKSKDQRFHRCVYNGKTRCLFVPDPET